jgi:ABC-type transport system substrate-binding protein
MWKYLSAGGTTVYLRTDKPPFNDKRVRQALSMMIDRKAFADATTNGEGEPDQALSWSGVFWKFRKPSELGSAAKYWEYNVPEAKKLLAAAGVTLPVKVDLPHWNATVIGQGFVDQVVLLESYWRTGGMLDVKDIELTFGQAASTIGIGNYDNIYIGPNITSATPDLGIQIRNKYYSPPEGIKSAPTLNIGWINDPQLSALAEKQLGVFDKEERIKTFRAMEDILAEQQYSVSATTSILAYFGDPAVKNMQTPRDAYNGAIPYVKYWWFQDGKAP